MMNASQRRTHEPRRGRPTRSSRTPLVCVALLAALVTSGRDAGAQDVSWETIPLPDLCRPVPGTPHLPALDDGEHVALSSPVNYAPEDAHTELPVPLLLQMLEREARRTGAAVEVYRGAPPLLARGTPAGIESVRTRLADIERSGRALEIELRVGLVPHDTSASAGEQVFEKRLRSGGLAQFGERRSRAFVSGWTVEVAADSGVAAPVIGTAFTGETLHLRADRVEGGRAVHVEGFLDLAELTALEEFDPDTRDFGMIQQPVVRSVQVAFSGRIAPGERLTVELRGAPHSSPDWTVWIEAVTGPDVTDAAGWSVLDLAFVSAPVAPLPPVLPGVGIDDWLPLAAAGVPLEPLPPSAVAAEVDTVRAHGDARGNSASRDPMHWTNSLLFLPATDELALTEARAFVAAAERGRLPTTSVEVRSGALSVTLPMSVGRPARVRAGEERTWLVDYGIEIAPETWMAEPVTGRAFDGFCVDLVASPQGVAGTAWVASSEAPSELDAERALLGRLQLPTRSFRGDSTRIGPEPGTAAVLAPGAGPGVTLILR